MRKRRPGRPRGPSTVGLEITLEKEYLTEAMEAARELGHPTVNSWIAAKVRQAIIQRRKK